MHLKPVAPSEIPAFRRMVEAYWQEIMPAADVVKHVQQRNAYFQQALSWQEGAQSPCWAISDGNMVGFTHYSLTPDHKRAIIEDFYVVPAHRRHGYGSAMVRALHHLFNTYGVKVVELNVRRDTPQALAFWEAQGFRIALYGMRQYRDPTTGQTFIGALSSDFDVAE
ncbi:MAG: GNAT family N-acetyltransferase [Chloroflexota bacterium]|nr:GNAT family N-acetyltransferase [Chloroflexota bacterium]